MNWLAEKRTELARGEWLDPDRGRVPFGERAVLTVDQVFDIAEAIRPRLRCLVLLAAFTSLRFSELAALRRAELDLDAREVRVLRSQSELRGGRLLTKDPKSAAGLRVVALPSALVPELRSHLKWFSEPVPDGLVFVGPLGGRLLRRNFRRRPAAYRQPPGSRDRREHQGADGAHGPLHEARSIDLPERYP